VSLSLIHSACFLLHIVHSSADAKITCTATTPHKMMISMPHASCYTSACSHAATHTAVDKTNTPMHPCTNTVWGNCRYISESDLDKALKHCVSTVDEVVFEIPRTAVFIAAITISIKQPGSRLKFHVADLCCMSSSKRLVQLPSTLLECVHITKQLVLFTVCIQQVSKRWPEPRYVAMSLVCAAHGPDSAGSCCYLTPDACGRSIK
jgi:hypothetical protein